ncbi:MAG: hypothetical protein OXD44_04760 [Gammaproteobacteria bacterium]|nr:hypothetical protein [Gammaproteobacteria bacterium]MCY4226390.1 hypothetical protein [Gammaproteobacteria bacterium]MCY4312999.1 hypothetical protein [Gammaproteobacteria bacterium]
MSQGFGHGGSPPALDEPARRHGPGAHSRISSRLDKGGEAKPPQ